MGREKENEGKKGKKGGKGKRMHQASRTKDLASPICPEGVMVWVI